MPSQSVVTHQLRGLQPQPLASYLSALGVLRLVHKVDPDVGGAWKDGSFALETVLTREELVDYFLHSYVPTPITSPWNGGSGYYPKDNKDGINAILATDSPRFAAYRHTLQANIAYLQQAGLTDKPADEAAKTNLLRNLRARLDDEALLWLDAATVQGEDSSGKPKVRYAPLLGTGGNDGRLEFSNNFMKRLEEMFLSPKAKSEVNRELLQSALFGSVGRFLKSSPVGQFDPGSAGGVNLSVGFEGAASVNPWTYILMMEGSLVLTATVVARLRDSSRTGGAFPFTVNHQGAGHGKLGQDEGHRNEIWLPLWEAVTSYQEVRSLFGEGRAQSGRQQARNPVEFSIALASHGTSRGIAGFSRFGFLQRNGKSFFATSLGYYPVEERLGASLLRQLETWLSMSRSGLRSTGSGQRALRRYDDVAMEYLATEKPGGLTLALERLGELHQYLCHSPKLWENVRPLPTIDPKWATLADDNSAEFRLARAVATLHDSKKPGETVRSQLTPYCVTKRAWDEAGWICRWKGRAVPERMTNLLEYRLRAHEGSTPVRGVFTASPEQIEMFLEGAFDDKRFERLLYGLCLLDLHRLEPLSPGQDPPAFLPLPFVLTKLALHQAPSYDKSGGGIAQDGWDQRTPPASIVSQLAAGHLGRALRDSRRFLLGRSLVIPTNLTLDHRLPIAAGQRLASALLFPISNNTYRILSRQLGQTTE